MSDLDTIVRFLAGHFGEQLPEGDQVLIRCLHARAKNPRTGDALEDHNFFTNLTAAARYALAMRGDWNVYFGVNPRRNRIGTKRGVSRIVCLHADVDAGPGKAYEDTVQAFNAVLRLTPRVDVILSSGGGLHCWWHIGSRPPATPETVRDAEALMGAMYRKLGDTDHVQDVSRILRLPCTINHKYGLETRIVHG